MSHITNCSDLSLSKQRFPVYTHPYALSPTYTTNLHTPTTSYIHQLQPPLPGPSPLHHLPQTPLLIPPHYILLHPTHRPPQPRPQHTQPRRDQLQRIHNNTQNTELARELDDLVDLVEIVLRADQICGWRRRRRVVFGVLLLLQLRHEMQDRDEGDVRGVEGEEPDAEELVEGDVEDEVFGIVGWMGGWLANVASFGFEGCCR